MIRACCFPLAPPSAMTGVASTTRTCCNQVAVYSPKVQENAPISFRTHVEFWKSEREKNTSEPPSSSATYGKGLGFLLQPRTERKNNLPTESSSRWRVVIQMNTTSVFLHRRQTQRVQAWHVHMLEFASCRAELRTTPSRLRRSDLKIPHSLVLRPSRPPKHKK